MASGFLKARRSQTAKEDKLHRFAMHGDILTFDGIVAASRQNRSSVHGELQRSRLGAFHMSAFDCHTRTHKVGFRLPHMESAIHAYYSMIPAVSKKPELSDVRTQYSPPPMRLASVE